MQGLQRINSMGAGVLPLLPRRVNSRQGLIRPSPRTLKHKRYPLEEPKDNMTLCIAAAADLNGEPVTVLSNDWRVENELYGSETMDKSADLVPGVYGLVSGNLQRAQELLGAYKTRLLKEPLVTDGPILKTLKRPFYSHRRQMIDEYLNETLGVSRKWFFENGKDKLPDSIYRQKIDEIRQINSGTAIILCAFVKVDGRERRIICVVDENQRTSLNQSAVFLELNFAAIGIGNTMAAASLHRREHDAHVPLRRALYHVREAMYFGGFTPGVGRSITMVVLRSNGKISGITRKAESMLENDLARYGPKTVDDAWGDDSGLLIEQTENVPDRP
jgi:hypothetical protein